MAIPVAAGMIFQTLYLLVDLYSVVAPGDGSVAGVGTAGNLAIHGHGANTGARG